MDGFTYFWANYPRHEAKKDAHKAWDALNPSLDQTNTIVRAVVEQIRHRQVKVARREWVPDWPLPASWIRGERWTDETPTAPVQAKPTYGKDEERDLV